MVSKREAPEPLQDTSGQQGKKVRIDPDRVFAAPADDAFNVISSTTNAEKDAEVPILSQAGLISHGNTRRSTARTESELDGVLNSAKASRGQSVNEDAESCFNDELSLTGDEWERIFQLPLSTLPDSESMKSQIQLLDFSITYGNQISRELGGGILKFYDSRNIPLQGHTQTNSSPDIIVCRERKGEQEHWSSLESVGEARDSEEEETKYTTYLLQARPDLAVAFTFQVETRGIVLIATDIRGSTYSPLLEWGSKILRDIFGAFIYRLYHPHPSMVDASICRVNFGEAGLFNVDLSGAKKDFTATYEISYVGSVFDGRKTLFKNVEHPETINNVKAIYVKEHYTSSSRIEECDVIEHIHENGNVPGVVKVLRHWQPPKIRGYKKFRLAEGDMGRRLMAARTPRELLTGIYDLLEITRYLYREKNVLHRDISEGNVFINSSNAEQCSIPASDLCCANYLLGNTDDSCALSCVLIDFNLADILKQKPNGNPDRIGTTVFIARAVAAGKANTGSLVEFRTMTPVPAALGERSYATILQSRVHKFRSAESRDAFMDTLPLEIRSLNLAFEEEIWARRWTEKHRDIYSSKWRHELRHDAESAFWLLVYWVVQALPLSDNPTEDTQIPEPVWTKLTEHWGANIPDQRGDLFLPLFTAITHPRYSGLMPFIMELWSHISSDHHWAPEGILRHPEYVHEALQRVILNFLMRGDEVLDEETNPTCHREVQDLSILR